MTTFLEEYQPDEVVAIGGGSPMDAAKAAYLTYQTGMDIDSLFGVNRFSSCQPNKTLKRVICLPTTSGTGSEATSYSNIVDRNLGVKKLISEEAIIPEYSFVNPELTKTMPKALTLATGCDALAHSIEGFLNIGQDDNNPAANQWAKTSIELLKENLPVAISSEGQANLQAWSAIAAAATLGGMVIRYKSTGLPHLCSFSWFGKIPHGLAVAILLPHCWRYYIADEKVRARTMELNHIFPGQTAEEVIESYEEFLKQCHAPISLSSFDGLTPEILEVTAINAGQNKMKLDLSPRPVPLEQSYQILKEILQEAFTSQV